MTYGELVAAIQNYCQSSEPLFTGQINTFIRTSEDRVYRSIQLPAFFTATADADFSSVDPDYTLPAGSIEVHGIRFTDTKDVVTGTWSYLLRKDYDYLMEAYPLTTDTGVPKYYALSGAGVSGSDPTVSIKIAPTPDDDGYGFSVEYYGKTAASSITSGGATGTKTWLSVTFPDVLLYGALADAYVFLKSDPQMIQYYEQRFHEGMATMASTVTGEQVDMGM